MKKSWLERFCRQIVRPHYQVMALVLTFMVILFFGWKAIRQYRPLEQWPEVQSVVPEKIKEWGGEPVVVDVGMYLTNWRVFDVVKNDFTVEGVVWFQFDPALISLETIGKFSFEKGIAFSVPLVSSIRTAVSGRMLIPALISTARLMVSTLSNSITVCTDTLYCCSIRSMSIRLGRSFSNAINFSDCSLCMSILDSDAK